MIYQLIDHTSGVRSLHFSANSLTDLARILEKSLEAVPEGQSSRVFGDDYVLVLMEVAPDGQTFASRAPMMKVSTLISIYSKPDVPAADLEKQLDEERANHE